MQNNETIRSILGLKQDELAALLSVTRSQLSMYELGKRDLPVDVKRKLAELLTNAHKKNLKKNKINDITKDDQQKIIKEFLFLTQREILNLEKKIIRLDKKIEKIENSTFLFKNLNRKDTVEKYRIEKQPHTELIKLKQNQFKHNIKIKILIENKIFLEKLL
jgi:transcriptional regulator with XRE-family HTH domain